MDLTCVPFTEVGSLKFHRYSQERTLNWLQKKVTIVQDIKAARENKKQVEKCEDV